MPIKASNILQYYYGNSKGGSNRCQTHNQKEGKKAHNQSPNRATDKQRIKPNGLQDQYY